MKKRFLCRYVTPEGETKKEVLEVYSVEDIKYYMAQHQYLLISYKTESDKISKLKKKMQRPLKDKELVEFCDQMYFVFSSGTSLIEGLNIIKRGNQNKRVAETIDFLYKEVESGNSLSHAMKSMEHLFPALLIHMVESGEVSSNMEDIFSEMKQYYEKQGDVKGKILSALIQPAILLFIGMIMLVYFLQVALPDLMGNLEIDQNQLPMITKVLIAISNFTSEYYLYMIFIIAVTIGGVIFAWQNEKVRFLGHKLILKIPVIGTTLRSLETFRVSLSLYLFLRSDVSILTALEIIESILKNTVAKKSVHETRKELLEGNTLSDGFSKVPFFDYKFVKYLEVGEETGSLESVMQNISTYYRNRIDEIIKKSLSLLEPVLTVTMAVMTGIIVAAVALPIFSMVDYIQ